MKLDKAFFVRVETARMENCKDRLWAARNPELGDGPELRDWFEEVWQQATGDLGLEECDVIGKFFDIAATAEVWQANPAWAFYVDQFLNDPYGAIPKADAVLVVHKHIIVDRVLTRPD